MLPRNDRLLILRVAFISFPLHAQTHAPSAHALRDRNEMNGACRMPAACVQVRGWVRARVSGAGAASSAGRVGILALVAVGEAAAARPAAPPATGGIRICAAVAVAAAAAR